MITYDYSDLLGELGADIIYGVLDKNETIQALREDRGIYKLIVDWYYSDERMEGILEELPPSHRENYKKNKKPAAKNERGRCHGRNGGSNEKYRR